MKLVMDTIFAHELDLRITPDMVKGRYDEWHALTHGCLSRSAYIKGLAAFMGLDLMEYGIASSVLNPKTGEFKVEVRSIIWQKRQR